MMVRVYCDFCGSSTSKSRKDVEEDEHHFCDNDCRLKWLSNGHSKADNVNKTIAVIDYLEETPVKPIMEYFDLAEQTIRTYIRELTRNDVLEKEKISNVNHYSLKETTDLHSKIERKIEKEGWSKHPLAKKGVKLFCSECGKDLGTFDEEKPLTIHREPYCENCFMKKIEKPITEWVE